METELTTEGVLNDPLIGPAQGDPEPEDADRAERPQAWWTNRLTVGSIVAVSAATVISIVIRMLTPLWIVLHGTDDDLLYVRLGNSLIHGGWLGAYDRRTLEKPPGFSMFLAIAHLIPLPYVLVVHLLHLGVVAFFAYTLGRVTSRRLLGVVVYIVLALDPSYFSNGASLVFRDNFYASMSLLLVALAMFAIPRIPNPVVRVRGRRDVAKLIGLGIAAGVVLTGYWLARAERPWLLPAIGLLLLGGLLMRRRNLRSATDHEPSRLRPWLLAALPIVIPCVVALGVLAGSLSFVAWKNERAYGVSIIDDFSTGEFARMASDWQSVDAGPQRQYISISHAQREAVYRISPAAQELEQFVESRDIGWWTFGCQATGVCDDLVAGWLLFDLRDATFFAGEYDNAREGQTFWARVADDIERACSDHRLSCRRQIPFSLFPDPSQIHLDKWWDSTVRDLRYMLDFKGADPRRPLSGLPQTPNDAEEWALFHDTVRGLPSSLEAQQSNEKDAAAWLDDLVHLRNSYRRTLVFAFPLAIVGYVVAGWRRRSKWSRVFLIGVGSATAVITRAVLIGLIDSTSFPAVNAPTYVLPASAFLLVFVVCGIHLLIGSLRPLRRPDDAEASLTAEDPQATPDGMLNSASAV
jgi:hypothetical protein